MLALTVASSSTVTGKLTTSDFSPHGEKRIAIQIRNTRKANETMKGTQQEYKTTHNWINHSLYFPQKKSLSVWTMERATEQEQARCKCPCYFRSQAHTKQAPRSTEEQSTGTGRDRACTRHAAATRDLAFLSRSRARRSSCGTVVPNPAASSSNAATLACTRGVAPGSTISTPETADSTRVPAAQEPSMTSSSPGLRPCTNGPSSPPHGKSSAIPASITAIRSFTSLASSSRSAPASASTTARDSGDTSSWKNCAQNLAAVRARGSRGSSAGGYPRPSGHASSAYSMMTSDSASGRPSTTRTGTLPWTGFRRSRVSLLLSRSSSTYSYRTPLSASAFRAMAAWALPQAPYSFTSLGSMAAAAISAVL
ncbi:hypothetical protein C2845_PM10G07620 [Panicum miliaceum]|uniref:Uncharacterized protein n=1 Tax=Panicum miliaceum TaxID=4540 RepID=A0A3L6PDR2_PANMI|nr:hypothetical protein C2845_PM10G07620 [Panicum miliaceum]